MLQLRPGCEQCNRELPPCSMDAMICSFECTFCRDCVEQHFGNVCPNCGGNLTPRSIRPAQDRRGGNYFGNYPASEDTVHRPKDIKSHQIFRADIASIRPEHR
jgi:uncharacterized protein